MAYETKKKKHLKPLTPKSNRKPNESPGEAE
jgi:hypothetical protein